MLADNLKTLLGCSYVYFTKAAGFHWNVEGENFPQYHEFLGDLYNDVYGSIDVLAEHIRTLDSYAPGSLSRMLELSKLSEQSKIPRAELMFAELIEDTKSMIGCLNECFSAANSENQQGIANYIAERLDAMNKHLWMMKSIMKRQRS